MSQFPRAYPSTGRAIGRASLSLSKLLSPLGLTIPPGSHATRITGITMDSGGVRKGSLFVAARGTRTDGHAFASDAVRRGAAAIVAEHALPERLGVPVIRVDNTRRVLAQLAAAWYGHPAQALSLVGITGTLGKTSTLTMLEAILSTAGANVGSVGSLGLRIRTDTREETGYTAPDPLLLHRELARAIDEGCDLVVMEVTSHALVQERVAGLEFKLGILTNLVPLEHQDYHGSFRSYVEAKRRFFEHLPPCTPLVYSADNQAARRLVHDYAIEPIGCGTARTAVVRIESLTVSERGTRFMLNVRRPIARVGGELTPLRIPIELRLLGRSNLSNAALAAAAALSLGTEPNIIEAALARFPPPRRRMQILHQGDFTIIDDTVGHPDSISAVFEVVEQLAPRRVHIAFAVRGQRGARINRQGARSLAIWCSRIPPATLIITRSAEAADERNRVEDREYDAFCQPLRDNGISFIESDRLDQAVERVLANAGPDDLVLLLGAQGMDHGQDVARTWLAERYEPHA